MSNRKRTLINHAAKPLTATQLAIAESRSLFPKARIMPTVNPDGLMALRKSSNAKIGKRIRKGWAKGMPIYTLTLEERATCPSSCHHWATCYGNNMRFAQRIAHGEALEAAVAHDVALLAQRHPEGFMVRLHVLGDFYSSAYASLWGDMLEAFPALHVFGYTARHTGRDPIGDILETIRQRFAKRFMIRESGQPHAMGAVKATDNVPGAVTCPEQTGKAADCASCGLCWTMSKPVAFVTH